MYNVFLCSIVLNSMVMEISLWMKMAPISIAAGVEKEACCIAAPCAALLFARYASTLTKVIFNFSFKKVEEAEESCD